MVASPRLITIVLFVATIILWGLTWPVLKVALRHIDPMWFGFVRFMIGALTLFAAQAFTTGIHWPKREDMPVVLVVGIVQIGLFICLMHYGVYLVGPGRSALLIYTTPIWTIPMAAFLLGEKISAANWAGVALGFLGLCIVFNPATVDYSSQKVIVGNIILLIGAILFSYPIVFARGHKWVSGPMDLAPWQQLTGAGVVLVCAIAYEGAPHLTIDIEGITAIVYAGAVASGFGMWAYVRASRELRSSTVALGSLGIPVIGMTASAIAYGDRIDLYTWAGLGLIIAGVAIGTLGDALGVAWGRRNVPPT